MYDFITRAEPFLTKSSYTNGRPPAFLLRTPFSGKSWGRGLLGLPRRYKERLSFKHSVCSLI